MSIHGILDLQYRQNLVIYVQQYMIRVLLLLFNLIIHNISFSYNDFQLRMSRLLKIYYRTHLLYFTRQRSLNV
jgi:hypothetical protein